MVFCTYPSLLLPHKQTQPLAHCISCYRHRHYWGWRQGALSRHMPSSRSKGGRRAVVSCGCFSSTGPTEQTRQPHWGSLSWVSDAAPTQLRHGSVGMRWAGLVVSAWDRDVQLCWVNRRLGRWHAAHPIPVLPPSTSNCHRPPRVPPRQLGAAGRWARAAHGEYGLCGKPPTAFRL